MPATCFEHCCAHHQEVKFYYTTSGNITPVDGRLVHMLRDDGHLQV